MAAVPATAPITSVAAKQSLLLLEARGATPAGLLLLLMMMMGLMVLFTSRGQGASASCLQGWGIPPPGGVSRRRGVPVE